MFSVEVVLAFDAKLFFSKTLLFKDELVHGPCL